MLKLTSHDFNFFLKVSIGDDNFLFDGNTDSTGQVTRYLPWSLYTNKVRLYPVSYSGAPEISFQLLGYAPGKRCLEYGLVWFNF